ncbi:MAG: hypothetical protein FWC60_03410 [Firmicutes bacterium]|nr:hypothetical protein [Bacillota bacterium]
MPEENNNSSEMTVKIRLDFKGQAKPKRFFFGGKSVDKVAEEIREQQIALFRNVPLQGVKIEDIEMSTEVYTVWDDFNNNEVAFAPITLTLTAGSITDLLRFIMREEFRKIEVIKPGQQYLTKFDMERLLFKIHEEFRSYSNRLEKKYTSL